MSLNDNSNVKNEITPQFIKGQRVILTSVHPSHDISKVHTLGHVGVIKNYWRSGHTWTYNVFFYASPGLNRNYSFLERYLSAFKDQKLMERDRFYFGKSNRNGQGWEFYPESVDQIPSFDESYAHDSSTISAVKEAFNKATKRWEASTAESILALEQLLEKYRNGDE